MRQRTILLIWALIILLWLFFTLAPRVLYPGSVGGNFGLRPVSHHCLGFLIDRETVQTHLPSHKGIKILGLEYRTTGNFDLYCLGQDVWYGE